MTQPTPTQILKLQGGFRPHRHADRIDERLIVGKPVMPRGLTAPQKRMWHCVVDSFPAGTLGQIDEPALRIMADLFQVWCDYKDATSPQEFYKGLAALKQWTNLASKFGLSPADRTKLRATVPDQNHEHDQRYFGG